jgi:hypothetical protein
MENFYQIEFDGYLKIKADSVEEAKEKFQDVLYYGSGFEDVHVSVPYIIKLSKGDDEEDD